MRRMRTMWNTGTCVRYRLGGSSGTRAHYGVRSIARVKSEVILAASSSASDTSSRSIGATFEPVPEPVGSD
jgi:hypothetical protein